MCTIFLRTRSTHIDPLDNLPYDSPQQTPHADSAIKQHWDNVWFLWGHSNTGHSPYVGSMLAHRLRRWPNIEPTHGQCFVFAGNVSPIVALPAPITGQYNKGIQYLSPEGLRGKNSIS